MHRSTLVKTNAEQAKLPYQKKHGRYVVRGPKRLVMLNGGFVMLQWDDLLLLQDCVLFVPRAGGKWSVAGPACLPQRSIMARRGELLAGAPRDRS